MINLSCNTILYILKRELIWYFNISCDLTIIIDIIFTSLFTHFIWIDISFEKLVGSNLIGHVVAHQ